MSDKTYKISEVFYSPQGEGRYTGQLTAWVRVFGCPLQCDGFGQADPTNPESYILPYKTFNVASVKRVEDLPVFDYGCDSSYSWSARFKHLCPKLTTDEIAEQILSKLPLRSFSQPKANNTIHLAFTGGEPLMSKAQEMMLGVVESLAAKGEDPFFVTVETNGTQILSPALIDEIYKYDNRNI